MSLVRPQRTQSLVSGCSELPSGTSLIVARHELTRIFQGLSLFVFNADVAIDGVSSSCLVGSSKNVVSFNSAVMSTVSWDWVSKLESLLLWLHAIEDVSGLVNVLRSWLSLWEVV